MVLTVQRASEVFGSQNMAKNTFNELSIIEIAPDSPLHWGGYSMPPDLPQGVLVKWRVPHLSFAYETANPTDHCYSVLCGQPL